MELWAYIAIGLVLGFIYVIVSRSVDSHLEETGLLQEQINGILLEFHRVNDEIVRLREDVDYLTPAPGEIEADIWADPDPGQEIEDPAVILEEA